MSDYTGPAVGYTDDELALELGRGIVRLLHEQGMNIIWKRIV
jgi:hypothetical protein